MQNLHDLFEHELQDIYDAEMRLVEALGEQAKESTDAKIKAGFEKHRRETEGQVERLEKVFEIWGREPSRGEGCAGIQGLIEEHDHFVEEEPADAVLDVFNLTAAAKVERYEITAYESLMRLAAQMGLDDAVKLLGQNLKEEENTLEKVLDMIDEPDLMEAIEVGEKTKTATGKRTARASR